MRPRLESLAVIAASFVTYATALGNRFAVDDDFVIAGNARVHQLADQAAIWLTPYWPAHGEQLGLYRPLAIFGYALQWALGGGAPWAFHLISVLLHAGVALLVLALLRRFVPGPAALAGALLFAVHPVHTEVVANVVGQAELIGALAVVGASVVVAARPAGAPLSPARVVGIAGLYAVALLAKENAIVLPLLLLVVELARGAGNPTRETPARVRGLLVPATSLALVAGAYLALRYRVLGSLAGSNAAPWLPFLREDGRVFSALRVWPEYARLMFFPADLAADYSPAVILPADGVSSMVGLGAILLIALIALACLVRVRPAAGLPAAWFLIAVLPVSNLLFPIGVLMAERLLYLPSVGLAIAAGYLWHHGAARARGPARRLSAIAAAVVLVLLCSRALVRNPDWRDSAAYYAALLRDHPESYRAQWGEAARRLSHGDRAGAFEAMNLAHRLWPHDAQLLSELALLHIWDHAYTRAVPLLEQASRLNDRLSRTWLNLAYVYIGVRRPEDARAAAARAETLGIDRAETRSLVAQSFELHEAWPEAARAWHETVREPRGRSWTYWTAYARVLARAGDTGEALAATDTARAIAPADHAALIDAVQHAIARGCYEPSQDERQDDACADPLAGWAIVTSVNALPAEAVPAVAWREPGAAPPAASSPRPGSGASAANNEAGTPARAEASR